MGFALCIRRSASTLASVCGRVARAQTVSAIVNRSSLVPKPSLLRPFVSRGFPYSTATEPLKSDQTLIQVIDSEIKDSFEADDHDADEETIDSTDFPFKIEDNPGHRTVTLTREYNGEQIKVEVSMPGLTMDENEDDVDDDEDGDGRHEKANESSIPLVVTVTKKSGLSLEFSCTAFPDEIVIDGLAVNRPDDSSEEQLTYDGPDFQELDENMRKSFLKFLETRGIKASATDFLYEYMMKKDSREYLLWLKKLKTFVQE
ncbi:putative mitochondrial glycoprotein [Arabidopsis thaliana]